MSSPLDDPDADFMVAVNEEQRYGMWPAPVAAPSVWTVAHGSAVKDDRLGYVGENRTDMRPVSA